MKILFFNANIDYAGASKMMVDVANSLSQKHEVAFLTFRSSEVTQNLSSRVNYVFDPLFKFKFKPIEMLGQIKALKKYLVVNEIDLIIAFLNPSNYMAIMAAFGTKTKVLLSERGDPTLRHKNRRVFRKFIKTMICKADAYVFQSEGACNAYPLHCRSKGEIIVNAIPNVTYPDYNPDNAKNIISVARFETIQKRQDVLVKAFAEFSAKHPEYVLKLVGDGPNENEIKQLVDSMGLGKKVEFLGARKDVLELLSKSTMFVLSSDYEGLPNALLEAMAVGVPSISTDCSPGGARMIIEDGVNGLIVPCGDEKTLSDAMSLLADNEEMRNEFSEKAVYVKEKFNYKKVEAQWMSLVDRLQSNK